MTERDTNNLPCTSRTSTLVYGRVSTPPATSAGVNVAPRSDLLGRRVELMCGVAGILARESEVEGLQHVVRKMTERMAHRGPDDSGTWSSSTGRVCLGHRRLSILDLSETGRQPMKSASGRFVTTFNGELYNFPELRNELASHGHSFRGTSDTEVLLAAFDQWGVPDSLERFVGMFALGVWDARERELILVRDRMGEKPLYYGWVGGDLVFASELKAFREHPGWRGDISREALAPLFAAFVCPAASVHLQRREKATSGELPQDFRWRRSRDVARAGRVLVRIRGGERRDRKSAPRRR